MRNKSGRAGFTLIELVIVILILGIVATVAVRQMAPAVETARYEQTKAELDQLAWAIAGNSAAYSIGTRPDFGYVGDVGALPPTLDALVQNPGDYATWRGPYIDPGAGGDDFKKDAWQAPYLYAGLSIRSVGSGADIDKAIAPDAARLLSNVVRGVFRNADGAPPGIQHCDSVVVQIIYPNGAGSMTTASTNPAATGSFQFTNIPVGNHRLRVVYLPDSSAITLNICVLPGKTASVDIVSAADLW